MRILLFVEFLKRERTGNRVDRRNCGDFHMRGLDREPEFAGVLEIIKWTERERERGKKEKKKEGNIDNRLMIVFFVCNRDLARN